MSDHINISDPDSRLNRMAWENRLERELAKTKLAHAESERDHWKSNLEAIFTRIRRGDDVWITDDNGGRIIVRAVPEAEAQ